MVGSEARGIWSSFGRDGHCKADRVARDGQGRPPQKAGRY